MSRPTHRHLSLSQSVVSLVVVAGAVSIGAAVRLSLIPPPPPPYLSLAVSDINARGDVLGVTHWRVNPDATWILQPFLYSATRGFRFPAQPDGAIFNAQGLNDRGDIVGWMRYASDENWTIHGALLARDGTFSLIDVPGAPGTFLTDINSSGTIVGYYFGDAGDSPFSYSDGTFTFLERAPEADAHMVPLSIANNGTIVGSYGGEFDSRGFILRDGAFTSVAYPGAGWTTLTGVAMDGTIVGAAAFRLENDPEGHGPWIGFVYRGGQFETLGESIFPSGINASRVVAGWMLDGDNVRGFTAVVRR